MVITIHARRVDQRHDQTPDCSPRITGSARQGLRRNVSRPDEARKVSRLTEKFIHLDIPVIGENRLRLEDDRPAQTDVELLVGKPALESRIDELLTRRNRSLAVDDAILRWLARSCGRVCLRKTDAHGFPPAGFGAQQARQHALEFRRDPRESASTRRNASSRALQRGEHTRR